MAAINHLNLTILNDPDHVEAIFNRGACKQNLGNHSCSKLRCVPLPFLFLLFCKQTFVVVQKSLMEV